MPKPYAFLPGEQYMLDGVGYQIIRVVSANHILVKNLMTKNEEAHNTRDLRKKWGEGLLEFGRQGRNLREEEGATVKTSYAFGDLDFLRTEPRGDELCQEVWDRYELIVPLIDRHRKARTDGDITKRIETYVAEQIKLIISRKRTRPLFPPHSGKGKKEEGPSQEETVASFLPCDDEAMEGVEVAGAQLLAGISLRLISVRQVRRWIEEFERSRRDIRSLVPAYYGRGKRGLQLSTEVEELLKAAVEEVYMTEQKATVKQVNDKLEFLILKANETRLDDQPALVMPGRKKIYRYIDQLDPVEIDVARFGRRYAQRKHAQYRGGPRPTRPNQRWEEDDTLGDLLVIDEDDGLPIGRPTFTAVRDKHSGVVPGISVSFEPPSSRTVLECLFYAIPEKDHVKELFGLRNDYVGYGVPEVLAVDRGSGYLNRDIEQACLQLGIELDPMPGKSPWLKGSIERYIETSGTELFHASPGTTFSNFLQRGDYDPAKHACITLNGLWYLMHKWIVDVYTRDYHRGIAGVPAKLWEQALDRDFVPRLPASRKELAVLLSRIESRVIQNAGIEFENLWYQDNQLSKLRDGLKGTPAFFKYNPGDISRIWVLDPFTKKYLEVLADDREYTRGLSIWKHRVIKRYVREEMMRSIDQRTLILAKEELYQAIHKEFRLGKKLSGRKRWARWLDIKVNEALRRGKSSGAGDPENDVFSLLIDFDRPDVELNDAEAPTVPGEEAEETPPGTVGGGVAQLEASLPPMIEGVTLPVNKELLKAGDQLPEPEKTSRENKTGSKKEDAGQPHARPEVNTDPDEETTFGIAFGYGRRGPT